MDEKTKDNLPPEYPAHIRTDLDGHRKYQSCKAHSHMTATYAGKALEAIHLYESAYFAGLLHDAGKFKPSYRAYLMLRTDGENVQRGSVIHTFAGVRYILKRYHGNGENMTYKDMASEILSYAAGAHHGLFDCVDEQHKNGYMHRLESLPEGDEDAINNFLKDCATEEALDALFAKSEKEISTLIEECPLFSAGDSDEVAFHLGLLVRLISSAVMEGDRRDTAEFMNDAHFPPVAEPKLWETLLARMEARLDGLNSDKPINKARRAISNRCRAFAVNPPGIYRLNVPTGGGKTLSSLRYALAHAAQYGKKRIIFTSPLLSILDQNSKVIRDYINDDSLVLEHHSNVVMDTDSEEWAQHELLTQSWSAPIIITTLVQLLNTMFDGKTASVRRFHALSDAVIVIDEVQTVPNKLLTLFNLAISFLAEVCKSTVVLCSATQPCSETVKHPIRTEVKDVIPYDPELWAVFKRTDISYTGAYGLNEIPLLAEQILETTDSLLIVCNKKSESEAIFRAMQEAGHDLFHLSAAMCMAHREKTLDGICRSLGKGGLSKTVCISTQVIEAGVDISFGAVIRLTAGMDSVVQSAGRCNRNGESEQLGRVYIVRIKEENLSRLPEIELAKQATEQLLNAFANSPERFDSDLASDAAIRCYYRQLFRNQRERDAAYHDFPVKNQPSLFSLLSWNDAWVSEKENDVRFTFRQAFATAGKAFSVFDGDTTDVIIPFGEGERIIAELLSERAQYDIGYVKSLTEQAKGYTVSLYAYQKKKLEEYHALIPLANGMMLGLDKHYYNSQTGLSTDAEQEVNNVCNTLIL